MFSNLEQYSRLAYEADEAKVEAENLIKLMIEEELESDKKS
jgi:hypothetical protein